MAGDSQHAREEREDGRFTDPEESSELEPQSPSPRRALGKSKMRIILNQHGSTARRLFETPPAEDGANHGASTSAPAEVQNILPGHSGDDNASQDLALGGGSENNRRPSETNGRPDSDPPSTIQNTRNRSSVQENRSGDAPNGGFERWNRGRTSQDELNQSLIDRFFDLSKELTTLRTQRHLDDVQKARRENGREEASCSRKRLVKGDDRPPRALPSSSRRVSFKENSSPHLPLL